MQNCFFNYLDKIMEYIINYLSICMYLDNGQYCLLILNLGIYYNGLISIQQ